MNDINQVMERMSQYGFDSLTTQDRIYLALELINYHGRKVPFSTLNELFSATDDKLSTYFDADQISKLRSINKLSSEWMLEKMSTEPLLYFNKPADCKDFFVKRLHAEPVEKFVAVFLDTKLKFMDYEVLTVGTSDRAIAYPKEIAKKALSKDCTAVIVAHNHPSGDPLPSSHDLNLTEKIGSALQTLDIQLLDHIVVGERDTFSFAENELDLSSKSPDYGINL